MKQTNKIQKNNNMLIGFIGLGLMGTPMTKCLLRSGFNVHVWNRSVQKTNSVVKVGAVSEDSISDLVKKCDIIMLCLSDTSAVEAVVFSDDGVANNGTASKILVDFSSIDPEKTVLFSQRLKNICSMDWIDAPVSGGVIGAERGELIIMAGGDAANIEKLRSVFKTLSSLVTHMGENGAGQITKICNQMIVGCNAMVIGEMIAMGRKAGISVENLPSALAGGFADSKPMQILGPQMAEHDFTLKWHVKTIIKDLMGAAKLSGENKTNTPMLNLALERLKAHGDKGHLDDDLSTLVLAYEQALKASET